MQFGVKKTILVTLELAQEEFELLYALANESHDKLSNGLGAEANGYDHLLRVLHKVNDELHTVTSASTYPPGVRGEGELAVRPWDEN
jgi:hypothetical protein